jgi:Dynamin family
MLSDGNASPANRPDDLNNTNLPLANTQYARSARAINELRDLGIERLQLDALEQNQLDLSLPKIVLVGMQSSGKSSLIEAISEIKVPQGTGTCTKCPMEVRLCESNSQAWNCNVSLRHSGPSIPPVIPFASTTDKRAVEDILRRAQLAILNPGHDIESFKGEDCSLPTGGAPFSEDTVVVEIVGAPCDITFIDLPGFVGVDAPVCILLRIH